jgi:capsular polysaccharide biosynthesis protein
MAVRKCQRGNDETNFLLCDKDSIVKLRKSVLAKYKIQGHESPKNRILTSQISVLILNSSVACEVFFFRFIARKLFRIHIGTKNLQKFTKKLQNIYKNTHWYKKFTKIYKNTHWYEKNYKNLQKYTLVQKIYKIVPVTNLL